jgi:hypothetical protein
MTQPFVVFFEQWDAMYAVHREHEDKKCELKSIIGHWVLMWNANVDHQDQGRKLPTRKVHE